MWATNFYIKNEQWAVKNKFNTYIFVLGTGCFILNGIFTDFWATTSRSYIVLSEALKVFNVK